jgi:DNA-directed RNA polymerase specialized sigma24 family protein
VDDSAEKRALAQCLERLEEQRQQSVLLAFVDGYPHEQVAVAPATTCDMSTKGARRQVGYQAKYVFYKQK